MGNDFMIQTKSARKGYLFFFIIIIARSNWGTSKTLRFTWQRYAHLNRPCDANVPVHVVDLARGRSITLYLEDERYEKVRNRERKILQIYQHKKKRYYKERNQIREQKR